MKTVKTHTNKTLGNKGELAVLDKLKTNGYSLYKKNFSKWGIEIDLIMYKYNPEARHLDIRVVEVKTRNYYEFNLSNFKLDLKWYRLIGYLFDIKESVIDDSSMNIRSSEIHFDLAVVRLKEGGDLSLYSYIKDVNLLF